MFSNLSGVPYCSKRSDVVLFLDNKSCDKDKADIMELLYANFQDLTGCCMLELDNLNRRYHV